MTDAVKLESPSALIRPNETTIPVLPCVAPDETLSFWRALDFNVSWDQRRPYLYLALSWSGIHLHYGAAPKGFDAASENGGGCLVMVDSVAPYHAAFTALLRRSYGKVLATGRPRITRFRPGASRFTIVDPSGNSIIFIQRDEAQHPQYGGSPALTGLARALDNARVLREFKNDDRAARAVLQAGLKRDAESATPTQLAQTYATLAELAVALDDAADARKWRDALAAIDLTRSERESIADELGRAERLEAWLDGRE